MPRFSVTCVIIWKREKSIRSRPATFPLHAIRYGIANVLIGKCYRESNEEISILLSILNVVRTLVYIFPAFHEQRSEKNEFIKPKTLNKKEKIKIQFVKGCHYNVSLRNVVSYFQACTEQCAQRRPVPVLYPEGRQTKFSSQMGVSF